MTALEKAAQAVCQTVGGVWERDLSDEPVRAWYFRTARAVLLAVREPDGPARSAAAAAIRRDLPDQYMDGPIAGLAFTAAIDAILNEGGA